MSGLVLEQRRFTSPFHYHYKFDVVRSHLLHASLKGYHVFCPSQGLSGIGSLRDDNEHMPPYAANTQEEDETANDEDAHPTAAVSFFRHFDHQCLYFLGFTFNPHMFLSQTGACQV